MLTDEHNSTGTRMHYVILLIRFFQCDHFPYGPGTRLYMYVGVAMAKHYQLHWSEHEIRDVNVDKVVT